MRITKENWWWQFWVLWLFSNFYQNNSKNAQRNAIESLISFRDSVPTTTKQAEEVRGHRQRMNPDPVMLQTSSFPETFAKFCEWGESKQRDRNLVFGYWSSPPKSHTSNFEIQFTALRWGAKSSLFPARYPSQKAALCQRPGFTCAPRWGHCKCHSCTSKLQHCT